MRVGVIALCCLSLVYAGLAGDADDYTAFKFLEAALCFQLFWSVPRLVYDAMVVLLHAPLPGRRASVAIVIGEWALSGLTHAAGACTLGVHVFFERDVCACAFLPPRACSRYRASALLALSASVLTSTIALVLFHLWAQHGHAQG